MKILKILSLTFFMALLFSCGNEYDIDEHFDLQELPGYVAFDAPGTSVNLEDVMTSEGAGSVSVRIECPTGTLSDINITYDISGDAVAGTDYNISNPGSITMTVKPTDFQNNDYVDLEVELLTDGVVDGIKTLTITLTGASNAEGTLAVGRGGTDLLKTINIIIGDDDCIADLSGTFDAVATSVNLAAGIPWDACDGNTWTGTVRWEANSNSSYLVYSSDANNPEALDYSMGAYYACNGDGATLPTDDTTGDLGLSDVCHMFSFSGASRWGEVYTITNLSVAGTALTFEWSNDYGEAGSTVLTRQDGNDWPDDLSF